MRKPESADGLEAFDGQRHCVAAPKAKSGNALSLAVALQGVEQRDQNTRATGADGVADGNRSAVNINPSGVEAKFPVDGQGLNRKCLVEAAKPSF